jgi:hypothetical protein
MKKAPRLPDLPAVFWAAIGISVSVILFAVFQWTLIDLITPFLVLPLRVALGLIFFSITIWSVVYWIRKRRQRFAALPTLVCVATIAIVALVTFTRLWINFNYWVNKADREKIVQLVSNGTLRPNVSYNRSLISLPTGSPHVSMGGNEIVVEEHLGKTYIFFFTYRGILDNYSGFLYVSPGGEPTRYSDLSEKESTQIEKFDESWYFAAHQ